MKSSSNHKHLWVYIVFSYFLTWVLFFEYILPATKLFPKPSVVLEAIDDLIRDYDLIIHFLSSIGVVYLSILTGYLIVYLIRDILLSKNTTILHIFKSMLWFARYFPAILLGIFLIYWFPGSEISEFIFAVVLNCFILLSVILTAKKKIKSEYVESAISFGADAKNVNRNIIWKSLLPEIKNEMFKLHMFLWSSIIVFEFIKGGYGIGVLLNSALLYNDISALVAISLLTGITIIMFYSAFRKILNRVVFWE